MRLVLDYSRTNIASKKVVSSFIYETNSTFNTNCLHLPLSVIVGIDNTRKPFLIVFCYIISKLATSFKWILEQLIEYIFYNYPKSTIIVEDFSKGLGATVATKAIADLTSKEASDNIH